MRTNKSIVLAMAAGVVLGACADDGTGPDALEPALAVNVALVAADATLEDLTLARVPLGFSHGVIPPGLGRAPTAGGAPGRPGGTAGIGGALSGTQSVTFYDASGQVQPAYDSLTTARIHYALDVEGEVKRGAWSGSVSRTRDMVVSGLLGVEANRIFNGTGSESVLRSRTLDDGSAATFDMAGTFIYDDVVIPVPGSDPRYPLSGSVTRTLKVEVVNGPRGDRTRDVTVIVTFDGDNTATVVVNGESFEIDLDARPGGFPLRPGFGKRKP